ncbi:MAG: elongation factor Ts [Clostridia bacterium]|jgi:elongation factor Ts|nr:elongation factor Ts [Clostridia bacterium]MBQ1375897.1 elongation factor Ts [Clostridia bacterium]MBQ1435341.1 elongation factor Ts [Clostridia bacterium]
MAAFTAKDVQALREKTGVGMMDCKKALTASDGDMEKAIEFLRERGLAAAAKKASRIAAEGIVDAYVTDNVGVLVEVNSETDFVAKNQSFKDYVAGVAKVVAEKDPADVAALLAMKYDDSLTVEEMLREKILTIGENLNIRRFERYTGKNVTYIHGGGKIGVMVNFDVDDATAKNEEFITMGKDVAMQIAALNPTFLSKETVPEDVIAKEKEINLAALKNDPKNSKKPENILVKIVEGKMGKYFEQTCLLQQPFVKNGDQTVAQYVAEVEKKLGTKISIVKFARLEKGEGLQKREDNFADEVAGMVK